MFSEYASRFLAQSQSRLNFAPSNDRDYRQGPERGRHQNGNTWRSATASRLHGQRGGNPYQPASSQISNFPFVSRLNAQQQHAPLFYSAHDQFREENDEEEHEREIADFYALQKSRRLAGAADLKESLEGIEESGSSLDGSGHDQGLYESGFGRGGGIRSSWRGDVNSARERGHDLYNLDESPEFRAHDSRSMVSDASRGKMSDVRLEDTMRSELDDEPPEDLMEDPPAVQRFRSSVLQHPGMGPERHGLLRQYTRSDMEHDSVPDIVPGQPSLNPRHDAFWGHLYLLAFSAMWATWFVVFLHTEAPDNFKRPLGDTVYSTLQGSFHLLTVYTVVAIFVSLFWLAALRAYVRFLVYGIVIAVPIVLYSFTLYTLVSSYKGTWHGTSTQDTVMRWSSLIPGCLATLWALAVIRGRLSMQKAISILEFATKILAANPALLLVGFAVLAIIVGFTWVWLAMFSRVFLGGHFSTRSLMTKFVIDAGTWWLGAYFIIVYLWTIGMIFGMQRAITSATVSQWYFHRLAVPAPSSQTIVKAAVSHSMTTLFGTVALSTGLGLLIRTPLLILPKRLTMLVGVLMYSMIPTPIAALINPLSLTYAAIHSQPLAVSATGLTQLHFLAPNDATTSLHPNTFQPPGGDGWSRDSSPLLPYRLSKLILYATRFIMSLTLGFGGWVSTARNLKTTDTNGVRGSLYAYIIGLIAAAIGWGILGAMEGVLVYIVDAVVVCWASEVGSSGQGEVRYCREAAYLFGGEPAGMEIHEREIPA